METNQTSQPEAPIESNTNHRTAYIVVGIFSLIVLLAVAAPFTLRLFETALDVPVAEQPLLRDDMKLLNSTYAKGSTLDAQQQYLISLEEKLNDPSLKPDARSLLLLRKAVVLSDARGDLDTFNQNMAQAIQILKQLINSQSLTAIDKHYNDFALVALVRDTLNCCTVSTTVIDDSPIFATYGQYKKAGMSDSVAALLTMDDITGQLAVDKADIMNKINSVDVATKLLLYYEDELSPEVKDRLLKELGAAVQEFPTLKPLTYKVDTFAKYERAQKQALAFDVYESMKADRSSAASNEEIDKKYEDAMTMIRAAAATAEDVHGAKAELLHGLTFYVESLDRRYGNKVNVIKRNALVDEVVDLSNSDPVLGMINMIYTKGAYDLSISNPADAKQRGYSLTFIELAKKTEKGVAYLKSIGVPL